MYGNYHKTIHLLANGINPITGEILPDISPYNHPEVIRALFTVLEKAKQSKGKTKKGHHLPLNHGKAWEQAEKESVTNLFKQGITAKDIATDLQRTTGSIRSELIKQGLITFE
jgi:DNA-binding NarL/FixJ family response regulator